MEFWKARELVLRVVAEMYKGRSFEDASDIIAEKAKTDEELRQALTHAAMSWACDQRQKEEQEQRKAREAKERKEQREASGRLVPCPFVYSTGRKCSGYVERVEAYKADLSWEQNENGDWVLEVGPSRSHYHLFCSEKGNHAGVGRDDALKYYVGELPNGLELL